MFSEEQLIEGCKRSQDLYCKALYQRYAGTMMSIALRYAHTTFEAEDILQEAFLKIFQSLHSFRYQGSFQGWLKRIVVNTAVNHYHKHKKHFVSTESEAQEESDILEEDILDRLQADDLIQVIQSLPEGYRIVFNLFELEGYSHKEIATLLGIEEGTSKSQLAKAKRFLRKRLASFDTKRTEWQKVG